MHGYVAILYVAKTSDRNLEGLTRPKNARIDYRPIKRVQPDELFGLSQAVVASERNSIELRLGRVRNESAEVKLSCYLPR
jgi:hypothetical protein